MGKDWKGVCGKDGKGTRSCSFRSVRVVNPKQLPEAPV